jgi:hypothetical protein
MQCNFYVGQKVVCVNSDPDAVPGFDRRLDGLTKNHVYTVRGVMNAPKVWGQRYPHLADQIWVYLVEIEREICASVDIEVGFVHWRFRPVTDISSLEVFLNKTPITA